LANPEIYYCVKPRPIQERESPWERPPVLRTVEGLLRPCRMRETPYHGLNFCQGTTAEMLDDPAREIFEVIRWFGERGKIFNVHFRNIKGKKLDFMEAFSDEGDMDMPRALAAYRDVGYP
jgi:mannonate dehydratase